MPSLDLTMRALALVALLLYLLPRFFAGRAANWMSRAAAATLALAFIIALVQSFFWFSS